MGVALGPDVTDTNVVPESEVGVASPCEGAEWREEEAIGFSSLSGNRSGEDSGEEWMEGLSPRTLSSSSNETPGRFFVSLGRCGMEVGGEEVELVLLALRSACSL